MIRLLVSMQMEFKIASINRMLKVNSFGNEHSKVLMMKETMVMIDTHIKNLEPNASKPVSNMFWMRLRMGMNDNNKNPVISFPFLVKEITRITQILTDPFNYTDTITSIELELKSIIDDLMLVEEMSIDTARQSKYNKLWNLLKTRVNSLIGADIDRITSLFNAIGASSEQRDVLLMEISKNFIEEYYRMSGKTL